MLNTYALHVKTTKEKQLKIDSYNRQQPLAIEDAHSPSNNPSFTASWTSPVMSLTPGLPITRDR